MALTVTATLGSGHTLHFLLAVRVVTGAAAAPAGATMTAGADQATITPQASGSFVYGSLGRTPTTYPSTAFSAATTILGDGGNGGSGSSWESVALAASSTTTASVPVTLGVTSESVDNPSLLLCEILANGTLAEDGSTPAVVGNGGFGISSLVNSQTTASFSPPAGAILVAIVAATGGGSAGTFNTVTVTDSASAYTWTQAIIGYESGGDANEGCLAIWTGTQAPVIPPGGSLQPQATWPHRRSSARGAWKTEAGPANAHGPSGQVQPRQTWAPRRKTARARTGGVLGQHSNATALVSGTTPPLAAFLGVHGRQALQRGRGRHQGTISRTTNALPAGLSSTVREQGLVSRRPHARGQWRGTPVSTVNGQIAMVQEASYFDYPSITITVTLDQPTAPGNALIAGITLTDPDNEPISIASVTDSAGNIWEYPTQANQVSPPSGWSYEPIASASGLAAMACCLNSSQPGGQVQPVTSVTVTWNRETSYINAVAVQEWAGLTPGAAVVAAASTPGVNSNESEWSQPITVPAVTGQALVAGCFEFNGGQKWITLPPFNGYDMVYVGLGTAPLAGDASYTLTWSDSSSVWPIFASAIFALGAEIGAGVTQPRATVPVPRRSHARATWRGAKPTFYQPVTAQIGIGFDIEITVTASVMSGFNIGKGIQASLFRMSTVPWQSSY